MAPVAGALGEQSAPCGAAAGGWCPENAVVRAWKARKSILDAARLHFWRDWPGANLKDASGEERKYGSRTCLIRSYSQNRPVCDNLESTAAQPVWGVQVVPELADWARQDETIDEDSGVPVMVPHRQVAGEGPRWRGRLNPSLFMTAVAVGRPQPGNREHGEACGREHRRVQGMTAEERARNDLPPPTTVGDGMGAPSDRLRAALIASALDRMAGGPRADRFDAVDRLVSLGVLPPISADPRDPMRQTLEAAVRQTGGAGGLAPFLRELKASVPDGLVPGANSAHSARAHGFRGLTATGRRSIRDACRLLEERHGATATGLVTLPDGHAETITREQLATYQSRWLFFARRMLIRRGLPPLVVIVAEWHPHRRTLSGAPIIHWHWVAPVSHGPYQEWAVKTADWHRVASQAYRAAFGVHRPDTNGCGAQPIRKSVGRYLSKYLSKGRSQAESLRGTKWERCVPRQWWTWTGELRGMVQDCRTKPPAAFLAWCVRWRSHLEALGEATTGPVRIGEEGPTIGWWFGWQSEEALDRAIRQWMEDEMKTIDAREGAGPEEPPWGPDPMQWWGADADRALGPD